MDLSKYKLELILVCIIMISPIAPIGVIIASFYAFYQVAFKKKLDILSLFLLLIPNIVLAEQKADGSEDFMGLFHILIPDLTSVVIVGPVAVSVKFFTALAVPVRLVYFIRAQTERKWMLVLWLACLVVSILGLYLTFSSGTSSAGGNTIGLRMVLSIGALLFPLSFLQKEFETQIAIIMKLTIVLFLLGLLNAHWIFIAVAFPPVLFFSEKRVIWKVLAVMTFLIFLLYNSTFTVKFSAILSLLFLLISSKKKQDIPILRLRLMRIIFFLIPVFIVLYVVRQGEMNIREDNGLEGKILHKLYEDRGGIWKYSIELISTSDFFVVPAARDISVYDYGIKGQSDWGAGAHNIYLEMARQLGMFATILLTIMMSFFLLSILTRKKSAYLSKITLAFFSIYLIFGLTGNDLVYDGVGFMYWLIVGQIYQLSKKYEDTPSIGRRRGYWRRKGSYSYA